MFRERVLSAAFSTLLVCAAAVHGQVARTHPVVPGETLFSIAIKELGAGARWPEIAALNNLAPPFVIQSGMVLQLPHDGASVPATASRDDEARRIDASDKSDIAAETAWSSDTSSPSTEPRIDFFRDRGRHRALSISPSAVLVRSERDVLAHALRSHPALRAASSEIEAARAGIEAARTAASFNPELELEGGQRRTPSGSGATGGTENEYGFMISREFEVAGQATYRERVANLELERTLALAEFRKNELIAEISLAFLEASTARELLGFAQDEADFRRALAEVAKGRYEVGDIARLEVSLADVEAGRATHSLLAAERDYRVALSKLRAAAAQHDLDLAPGSLAITEREALGAPSDAAFNGRGDLRAAMLAERILREKAQLLIAEGRPNITLGGGYRREENADIVAGRVTIPLPFGNRKRGDAARSEREADAAAAGAEFLRARIREETAAALESFKSADARLIHLRGAVIARSEENLSLLLDAYRENQIGLAEIVLHQSEAFLSRRLYLEASTEKRRAEIEWERAMGVPSATGLSSNREISIIGGQP